MLPDTLIPYYSITIDSFMRIMELGVANERSSNFILGILYQSIPDKAFNVSEKTLIRYYQIFAQVHLKLKLFYQKKKSRPPPDFISFTQKQHVNFIQTFSSQDNFHKGPLGISNFYYSSEGSYLKNARFLFGTAYQFRH